MKIYNQKYFFLGLVAAALAVVPLFSDKSLHLDDWLRGALLSIFAVSSLYTALNKQRAKVAAINDQDEREQMLILKAYRTAFWAGIVLLAAVGAVLSLNGSSSIQPMAAGFMLSAILLVAIHWFLRLLDI